MTHASTAIRSVTPPRVGPAAAWLARRVVRTPVVRCAVLDRQAGVRLWLTQRYGMAATVVLPRDAAPVKVARARSLGAQRAA